MTSAPIQVNPLSSDPTKAWECMEHSQVVQRLKPMPVKTPVQPDKVRFVCLSDTHALQSRMPEPIPDGDVLLHAGDFTRCGMDSEVAEFNNFLGQLPHKHKIAIAGNHELGLDRRATNQTQYGRLPSLSETPKLENNQDILTNATYLQDSETCVYGIKIYGTPWQPEFCNWAFQLPRGEPCLEKWNLIPNDTDILLTHSPPLGHGDLCWSGVRAGCAELLSTVQQRVKPKFHVFGHIHEAYGITTDGNTAFINCATCNINFQPTNSPIIFDYPLPPGQTKG